MEKMNILTPKPSVDAPVPSFVMLEVDYATGSNVGYSYMVSTDEDKIPSAGETQDNRFAVVNGKVFDITSYADCANGKDYINLTVSICEGVHNIYHNPIAKRSSLIEPIKEFICETSSNEEFMEATKMIHAKFFELIQEELNKF
jgi:hypothetical protein